MYVVSILSTEFWKGLHVTFVNVVNFILVAYVVDIVDASLDAGISLSIGLDFSSYMPSSSPLYS
jgi:hypothetical protein